ncbi:MAG: hypothetical protein QMC83_07220 [Thermodesulfovibrionales bacterium]|nr:hypothetical protein [Thermodesulfovibrionales bacterium]
MRKIDGNNVKTKDWEEKEVLSYYAKGKFYSIPSFVASIVDPTGCGDTYMAGYIYKTQIQR